MDLFWNVECCVGFFLTTDGLMTLSSSSQKRNLNSAVDLRRTNT